MTRAATALIALPLLALAALPGCGGAASSSPAPGRSLPPRPAEPLDFALQGTDGSRLRLAQLRGRPVLLLLFATFDGASQAAVRPLAAFARRHPELAVVAVAAQPGPLSLVEAWEAALRPPFPVAWNPDMALLEGRTALGPLRRVPLLLWVDPRGRPCDRHEGYASRRRLERMRARCLPGASRPP